MADSTPLAGLLDRAGRVFLLAEQLGNAFCDEYDRQRTGLRTVDPAAWSRHEAAFDTFSAAVVDLRDEMQNPPDGFAPVAQVLLEAARVAKQIRDTMLTADGQTWQLFLDFRFHFASIVANGNEAILAVAKAKRLDDPFAFLDKSAAKRVEGIDTTPTMPKPPNELVEAAERAIPVILADVPAESFQLMLPSAAHLVALMRKAEHSLAAAQWAIHESVMAGRLEAGRVIMDLPSVKTDSGWYGGGKGTKVIPKDRPAPFDCFKVIATQSLWTWWRTLGTAKRYDPCEREPKTFGELTAWMAYWLAFLKPRSSGLRAPTVASSADHHYLESYCKEVFGGFDLEILGKLRTRYIVQTSKTVEQINVTSLQELAEHFSRLVADQKGRGAPTANSRGGTTTNPRRGGRPKLSDSKKDMAQARHNLYEVIAGVKAENPTWGKKDLQTHFKTDRDFQDRVKSAGLKSDLKFFHAALVWLSRKLDHETPSQNVS